MRPLLTLLCLLVIATASMLVPACAAEDDYPIVVGDTSDGPDQVVIDTSQFPDLFPPDAGEDVVSKTMSPDEAARYWGKKWCDKGYTGWDSGTACTNTYFNSGWRTGCYNWMDSMVTAQPSDDCKSKFAALHYCEVSFFIIDPPGSPPPYPYGNNGCWECDAPPAGSGYPYLRDCDRCSAERLAWENSCR